MFTSGLSVCMIVKNESAHLRRALTSAVKVASEIIIIDTGSTDDTKEIAQSFGALVFDYKWCDDFAAARNESKRMAGLCGLMRMTKSPR
jgi:glycosyltransferase involved in cell wall biosynthesis